MKHLDVSCIITYVCNMRDMSEEFASSDFRFSIVQQFLKPVESWSRLRVEAPADIHDFPKYFRETDFTELAVIGQ